MQPSDLFLDEVVRLRKGANACLPRVKNVSDGFLTRKVQALIGPDGYDYIGGNLHLTNYRLKFVSHVAIGQPVQFTIFLPSIQNVVDVSRFVQRKLRVILPVGNFIEFVMWGIPAFIGAVNIERERANRLDWDKIAIDIKNRPNKVGDWAVPLT